MFEFKKYPEIENHFYEKYIQEVREYIKEKENVDIDLLKYIVELKDDGSNLSLLVSPDGSINLYTRMGDLIGTAETAEGFFDVAGTLKRPEYVELLDKMKMAARSENTTLQFYGEYYGGEIQRRITYGPDKDLKYIHLFGLRRFEGESSFIIPPVDFDSFLEKYNMKQFRSTVIAFCETLEAALNIDISGILEPSNPVGKNTIEGVVIKPYLRNIYNQDGIFYIKKKNEKFGERNKKPETAPEIVNLNSVFSEYITVNRVEGIYSKLGKRIRQPSEVGDYIRAVLDDAKKDFLKDHEGLELTKEQQKIVFNVRDKVLQILKKEF